MAEEGGWRVGGEGREAKGRGRGKGAGQIGGRRETAAGGRREGGTEQGRCRGDGGRLAGIVGTTALIANLNYFNLVHPLGDGCERAEGARSPQALER